jgi:hypothetical protein
MQYPQWLMVAGAVLVVVGFIGFAFQKNAQPPEEQAFAPPEERSLTDRQFPPVPFTALTAVGEMTSNTRAGASSAFQNVCHCSRDLKIRSPDCQSPRNRRAMPRCMLSFQHIVRCAL